LDSQFRCGKCGNPISSKYAKCLDCGSLGPHTYSGSVGSAVEGGPPVAHPPKRRDTYPAEQVDRQQPSPARTHERYEAAQPMDIADEPPRSRPIHDSEDNSKFPVGMRPRSPILDYVEDMDESGDKEPKRHYKREDDRDSEDETDDSDSYVSDDNDDDEERRKKPAPETSNSTLTWVVSIILIFVLIIAAIYVINNYDELSKWLASPTVPEIFKPSE
jgi:hypothetical protein